MLLLTKVKHFSNLLLLCLKYPYLQLLIQTPQSYVGHRHKLPKSKHSHFFNITLTWLKMWRLWCCRYLRNHGFPVCEKFQCLTFKYTEVTHKQLYNCVWYLWICPHTTKVLKYELWNVVYMWMLPLCYLQAFFSLRIELVVFSNICMVLDICNTDKKSSNFC